ncbi:MAG TPA: hypothetical protein VF139_14825 [Candidatus Polarisedimenticolaceae bacterium]
MRLPVVPFVLAGIAALLPASVRADQVVYFTNGTSMEVRSHNVDGTMIRVDLGGGAVVGFPRAMVERIEDRGKSVYTNPSFSPSNQAVAGSSGPARVQQDTTAITGVPPGARFRQVGPRPSGGVDPNNPLVQAAYGDAGVPASPRPETISAGNGRIKVRGRMRSPGAPADAPLGATPLGNNYAVGAEPNRGADVQIMEFQPRKQPLAAPSTPQPAPPAPESNVEGGEN